MPVLAAAQREIVGVSFVFANQGEDAFTMERFLAESRLELGNVVLDRNKQLGQKYGSMALPTTLFYDRSGRLVDAHLGALSAASLASKLERLVGTSRSGVLRLFYAKSDARSGLSTLHRQRQVLCSEDLDRPLQVVGQRLQTHLGSNSRQCLGQEGARAHPGLQRSEHMLDRLTSQPRRLRGAIQSCLNYAEYSLVLPAGDATIGARGALALDRTGGTRGGPVVV